LVFAIASPALAKAGEKIIFQRSPNPGEVENGRKAYAAVGGLKRMVDVWRCHQRRRQVWLRGEDRPKSMGHIDILVITPASLNGFRMTRKMARPVISRAVGSDVDFGCAPSSRFKAVYPLHDQRRAMARSSTFLDDVQNSGRETGFPLMLPLKVD